MCFWYGRGVLLFHMWCSRRCRYQPIMLQAHIWFLIASLGYVTYDIIFGFIPLYCTTSNCVSFSAVAATQSNFFTVFWVNKEKSSPPAPIAPKHSGVIFRPLHTCSMPYSTFLHCWYTTVHISSSVLSGPQRWETWYHQRFI